MKNNTIAYHSLLGDLWSLNTKQRPACLNQCWNPWWKLASKRQISHGYGFDMFKWFMKWSSEHMMWGLKFGHQVAWQCDRFVKLNSKSACAKSCCPLKSSLPCPLINGKTESHAYKKFHPFPIPISTCQTISKLATFSCLGILGVVLPKKFSFSCYHFLRPRFWRQINVSHLSNCFDFDPCF